MEIEDFLKSKGLFYTRDLINIMDETINLPKIMVLFAKLYHESELKKLRVGDVSGRSEQLVNFLLHLNDKKLINNHDFDYEKEAKKYLKKITNCH